VVDGANLPLAGVAVTVSGPGATERDPAITDAQGRFAFSGLEAGDYNLWAEAGGFGSVPYGETSERGAGSPVRVGGESGDKSVVFRIQRRGLIEGVIRDEFGDPMAGSPVFLMRPAWRGGRGTLNVVDGSKQTDDRGRYRMGNLAPGTYMVCSGDSGGQGSPAPVAGPVDFATRIDRYYARTCSRTFQLSPGQHTQIDLNPSAVAMATVRGHVRNVPPQSAMAVYLKPQDADQQLNRLSISTVASQETFTIRAVPPGHYILHAQTFAAAAQKSLFVDMPLEVGGSDIDGVEVDLAAQATVNVVFHGVEDTRPLNVNLRGPGGENRAFSLANDGSFHDEGVPAGNYRLLLQTPYGSCVESVKLGDTEMRGASFAVVAGATLHFDVAVTQSCGAVRARAVRDGQAIPGAKIVLLASGTPDDPGDLTEEFTDDEGGFTFTGLSPGHYLVWAWAVEGRGAMAGPESLAAVAKKATAVDVSAGDPVSVDVPLLPAEGQ